MDVKDLRTETALSERNNDGSKYAQGGVVALQCNRNKSYQDIAHNPSAKAEPTPVRPCAVIGPDRVVPPPTANDPYLKKGSLEQWPSPDNVYRRLPEYPHKLSHQNPSRNISPRQTFQENMQRIMVPPTYNVARHSDDANFNHIQDRNIPISKNAKPNVAPDAKYCDVPYVINTLTNEPKTEMYVPSMNSPLTRTPSHGWPVGSVNVHTPRTYSAHELYQYPQYQSCAGQRPTIIPMNGPHRTIQEEAAYGYPDHYYQDPSARFKPYPPVKERYQQPRYEYIGNYQSQFHPSPPMQPHKYDTPKSGSHPYPMYPHLKYLDNRVPDHTLEGYQRVTNQQPNYNLPFRNQIIHPTYAPVPTNSLQSKLPPYPPDGSVKTVTSNKLHFENNSKMYIDYENARTKTYPMVDNYYVNGMSRVHPAKNHMVLPNYSPFGMHSIPSQQHYRKDNTQMKPYENMPHFRNFEPHLNNSAMLRHAPQFSPKTLAISPTDSNISNDTSQTHGTSQEDCGYNSQSSTASVRSFNPSLYRLPHEYNKRYDFRYGPIVGSSPILTKSDLNSNDVNSKDNKQKQIDVRQFLQMWNEGEEDFENNNSKEIVIQTGSSESNNLSNQHLSNQDQLYVLGSVTVPSEELSKYEHIQKISKLPENIKGYNNLELLSQFEDAIESSNSSSFNLIPKEYQMPLKDNSTKQMIEALPRPLSPLDVEAKISQSVIHKEVGCNFEIRPCSPKMLNVEIAAPVQNVLGERVIEKVTNPLSKTVKSPIPNKPDENSNCRTIKRQENHFTMNDNPSCKMIKSPYATNNMDSVKTNYSLQDLEINSGVCLASLPRLDNEIELNFPEVNQQFINANKKDDISTTKNCPQLDLIEETNLSDSKLVKINAEKEDTKVNESDKTFSKLSKYRKSKTNSYDISGNIHLTKVVRTDSVIIKNPENLKNIEDKLLENSNNLPINLSSQLSVTHESPDKLNENNDADIALDFSLNKSSNDLLIEMKEEESPKLFPTHLLQKSCENLSPTDSNESDRNTAEDENQLLDSNNTVGKCIRNEPDHDNSCIKNDEEILKDDQDIINETTIKSVERNVIDTLVSNNTHSDSLISENVEYINNNIDEEMFESLETGKENKCVVSMKYDTHDNITQKNNMCNGNKESQFLNDKNENEAIRNKQSTSSKNNNDFEHDEISASLEMLFQESNKETTMLNTRNSCMEISVSIPSKILCKSKELFSPWIQKLLTHTEGLCSNIRNKNTQKESLTNNTNVDVYKPMLISMDMSVEAQSKSKNKDHDNRTRNKLPLTKSNKKFVENINENLTSDEKYIMTAKSYDSQPHTTTNLINDISNSIVQDTAEKTRKLYTEKLCLEKSLSDQIEGDNCKTNSQVNIETKKRNYVSLLKPFELQESVNEMMNCDSALSSVLRIDDKIKTITTSETYSTEKMLNCKKNVDNTENMNSTFSCASSTEYEVATDKEHLRCETLIENENKVSDFSEIFDKSNTVYDNCNSVPQNLNNRTFEKLTSNVSHNCIRHQKEENQCSERLTMIVDNNNKGHEAFNNKNQGADKQKEERLSVNCDKNTGETSKTSYEDHDSFENIYNKTNNNCVERQRIENQDIDKIGNHDNTGKLFETLNSSRMIPKNNNNPVFEKSANSVCLKYEKHEAKQNKVSEKIIGNDVIAIQNIRTDKLLQDIDSTNVTQGDDTGLERLSYNFSNSSAEYQTKKTEYKTNYDREKKTENNVIDNQDNDTGAILDTFENSNIFQKDFNPEPQSWPISADNCIKNQNNESKDEVSVMIESNMMKKHDNNETKIDIFDNNTCKFAETVIKNHKIDVSNNSTEHEKEIDQCISNSIANVNNDRKDTNELRSETLNSCVVRQEENTIKRDQNNVFPDILSNSIIGNIDCTEHQRQENSNIEKFIENVIEDCKYANNTETSENSKIVEVIHSKPSPKNVSNGFPNIISGHQTTKDQDRKMFIHISDNNTNKISKTSSNVVCQFNQTTSEEQNVSSSGTLFYDVFDDCTGNQTDKSETANKMCKKVIQNPKSLTENEKSIKNRNACIDTISNNVISSASDNHHDSVQENDSNHKMHNCVFVQSPKHKTEGNTLSNKSNSETGQKCLQHDNNSENIYCGKEENTQIDLKNRLSNIHGQENPVQDSPARSKMSLKRSFSDSALHSKSNDISDRQIIDSTSLVWSSKRPRMYEYGNPEQHVIGENLCRFIQNNRRNSVSSFCNEDNVSFCILIDNDCIITEDEEEKICFAEIPEDCITELNTANHEDNESEVICCSQENELDFSDSVILDYENEKSIQESWLDDVACVETVVSDDIDESIVNSPHVSPRGIEVSEYEESGIYNSSISEYTDEINFINHDEEAMLANVCQVEETYGSSDVDLRRMLDHEEPEDIDFCSTYSTYSGKCLENILSESDNREGSLPITILLQTKHKESILLPDDSSKSEIPEDKENIFMENTTVQSCKNYIDCNDVASENANNLNDTNQTGTSSNVIHANAVEFCESSTDNVFRYKEEDDVNVDYTAFSSPEVSSTTFEEKSSSILLKITNYNGSIVSEINEFRRNKPRCKFTEEKEYSNSTASFPKRPLITKAAQKYIPPLKESICDLKVKLPLPQQRLLKLKQLKLSIKEPKIMKQKNSFPTVLKKPKPNFEDVLKNIDKVQIKLHKEKSKKGKNIVPKVVIKKNLNGSHYTSSLNKDTFNPDLTGRKWQPWVFLEKNRFIDSMAIRNKTKAVFSHRKNTYVLAEKFKKYKSVSNCSAKFVISQPKTGNTSTGQLKYTIRLKHTY